MKIVLRRVGFFCRGLSVLRVPETQGTLESVSMTTRSEVMDRLYGEKTSKRVFDRLEYLDSKLNEEIQKVAYDHYWALPGISIRDKSLVTITSLIVMGKEEQTRIHLNGFLNSGGTIEQATALLLHLAKTNSEKSARNGFSALKDVLKEREVSEETMLALTSAFNKELLAKSGEFILNTNDTHMVDVSSAVASGNLDKIDESISKYLDDHDGEYENLRHIMIHQVVYCGFPSAMNGFARLRKVLEEKMSCAIPETTLK